MHWLDWLCVALMLGLVTAIAVYTQRFVKGVADFLAAGRVAGRYVVAVSSGEAAMGLVSMVAIWEMYYKSGFAIEFWNRISIPVGLLLMVTGYCIYRFRETRALTMGQMLEIRYSRKFRIFAGCLSALSGIINYGLFPAVGARFIVYFCNLPPWVEFFGLQWPTFALVMAVILAVGASLAMMGGQLTVMTTDCVMGILSYPVYLLVVFYLLSQFSWWNEIAPSLLDRPEGQSMLNPFDTSGLRDFNLFYVFVGIFASIYGGAGLTWLGTQGYNAAAINAHEQKMSRILGLWRGGFLGMMIILTSAVAYTYMHHEGHKGAADVTKANLEEQALRDIAPKYAPSAHDAASIGEAVARLKEEQPATHQTFETIQKQMLVPTVLSDILPVGLLGLFCALMIFLMTSTDSSYMHSWGSIIVQDIAMPLRKKPFTPREQLFWLRTAIAGVAVYAFLFSYFFGQVTYILMFFAITGAIWAGAGAVIVLGLYWSRGTAAGAWVALILGATIAVGGMVLTNAWVGMIYPLLTSNPALLGWLTSAVETISGPMEPYILWRVTSEKFFMNGQEINFLAMVAAIVGYVGVSLLTCREKFNMDRMLHRGEYQRADDSLEPPLLAQARKKGIGVILKSLTGIDANFTRGDKILSWSVIIWSLGWGFGSFITIVVWNLISPWPQQWWVNWFFIASIVVSSIIGIISTVWFTIGGSRDLLLMFRRLKNHQTDLADDGRVVGHVSAEDLPHEAHSSIENPPSNP